MDGTNELRQRNINNKQQSIEKFKHLKIYVCTWNVNTKEPKFCLKNLLKLNDSANYIPPDIYVIGLQEVNSKPLQYLLDLIFNDPWTNELTKELSKYDYIRLKTTRLVGILLNIYVKKSIIPFIRHSIIDWIRLGFFGLWGNKGANICSINIGNFEICFINSHLSAQEENNSKRSKEYKEIINKKINLINKLEKIIEQNYIFFFGDLNYRIHDLNIDVIKDKILNKDYDYLLKHDQLKLSIKNGDCFNNFNEGEINFAPTYKFDNHTDTYDTTKKKRRPAWCDRIFYKIDENNSNVECEVESYDSINELKISDHKPVYGVYLIKVLNWESFGTLVNFSNIQANAEQELEFIYTINEDLITHSRDWIGLYNSELTYFNDYITYIWTERIYELEEIRKLNETTEKKYFKKSTKISNHYLNNGKYVLGYFSNTFNQLVGLSEPFDIKINWL